MKVATKAGGTRTPRRDERMKRVCCLIQCVVVKFAHAKTKTHEKHLDKEEINGTCKC